MNSKEEIDLNKEETKEVKEVKEEKKTSNSFIVACVFVLIAFFSGFYFSDSLWQSKIETSDKELSKFDLQLLGQVIKELSASYVDPSKIEKQKMVYGIIEGAVSSIGDPYTMFFDPQQTKNFKDDISGTFSGIGVQVGMKNDVLKVIAPIKGTPAEKAGILPGDIILQVDKESIAHLPVDEVVKKIKGTKGTKVNLTINRSGETKDFEIERDIIKVPAMDLKIENKDGKKIAYLQIFQFSEQVYADFKREVPNLKSADAIILDLRNNPGGLVDQTKMIASWFMKKDDIVLTQQDRNNNKDNVVSLGYDELRSKPMVILVNEGSASASEILAGSLRDNNGIKIIGKKSFGKGSVQKVVDLDEGSSLKVTIAKWFTPKGVAIQDVGIVPDIEVERTEDDYKNNKDPQLDKAYEEIIKITK
ncbi:MAG: S41 family peptidase [Candidatus Pacebacteria bacterium]|nr:S41 family peptidase [Candidatus Paceibacterota bacterium]